MIAPSVVQEVRRLLAGGGFSHRKIAKITGISRGTVGAIASGRRRDHESSRPLEGGEFPEATGPLRRCPGCGAMVYMPCRLCGTRALKERSSKRRARAWVMQPEEPLGLALRDEEQSRYEEVRSRRVSALSCETRCEASRPSEGPRIERDDLEGAFEVENEDWELDPADLWDALDWDDQRPVYDEQLLRNSLGR